MSSDFQIYAEICHSDQNLPLVREFLRFRKELFVDALGWPLNVSNGMETDQFDNKDAVYCTLRSGPKVVGGFRAIRTDQPYLAKAVFPELASSQNYPQRPDIWEISRFGIRPDRQSIRLAMLNYAAMFRFAFDRQASALVALADPTYERYLALHGVITKRYGPPRIIEHDNHGRPVHAVAGEIPLAEQSGEKFDALAQVAMNMDMRDETLFQRPEKISA